MNQVSFEVSKEDKAVIHQIVERAQREGFVRGARNRKHWYESLDAIMDLTAVHANGMPLRLADLLKADSLNFIHDIAGIARHIDRETGKLQHSFVPRYAKR